MELKLLAHFQIMVTPPFSTQQNVSNSTFGLVLLRKKGQLKEKIQR